MGRVVLLCVLVFLAGACTLKPGRQGAAAEGKEQTDMVDTQTTPKIEYRICGAAYRIVAKTDETNRAQITAVETAPGEDLEPVSAEVKITKEAREKLADILKQIRLVPWDEKLAVAQAQAVLVTAAGGAAWSEAELKAPGGAQQLRNWAEANLSLALRASDLAKSIGLAAEAGGKLDIATGAYMEAIERLEPWWQPEGPFRDETGTVLSDGTVARKYGDYVAAISSFKRVLGKRTINYRKKYGL